MRITDIQERSVSIASGIRNAYIDFGTMTVSVAAVTTDVVKRGRPVVGYGFSSNGRYAQGEIIRDRLVPRILAAPPESLCTPAGDNLDPARIWAAMMTDEKPGGHGERSVAVGVIDMALWDAAAKIEERPLHALLADRYRDGEADERVFVYAAGGYYDADARAGGLVREMRGYLAAGYTHVKMKIGGASLDEDLRRIESVLEVLGDGARLAVDANGRFDLETALAYADALRPYGLMWFEEAGDPLDYALQAELSKVYDAPMATGENLFSTADARNLLRYAGMRSDRDVVQFDPALSYGLVEYLRTLDAMRELGWSPRRCIPHGGHQFALAIAAGLGLGGNESYPGIFAPFGGFHDGAPVEGGTIGLPEVPGIGFEVKSELWQLFERSFG